MCGDHGQCVSAPIDPQTGTFSLNDGDFARVNVNGTFFVSNPGYNPEINSTLTSGDCNWVAPNGYA